MIQASQPKTIFHLGGMLSMPSEQNSQAAFQASVMDAYNKWFLAFRGLPIFSERSSLRGKMQSVAYHVLKI